MEAPERRVSLESVDFLTLVVMHENRSHMTGHAATAGVVLEKRLTLCQEPAS